MKADKALTATCDALDEHNVLRSSSNLFILGRLNRCDCFTHLPIPRTFELCY